MAAFRILVPVAGTGAAVGEAWPVGAGTVFHGKIAQHSEQLSQVAQLMTEQASMANGYADHLRGLKTDNSTLITQHSPKFTKNPFYFPDLWPYLLWIWAQIEQLLADSVQRLIAWLSRAPDLPAEGFKWTGELEDGLSLDDLKDFKFEGGISYKGPGRSIRSPDGTVVGESREHDCSLTGSLGLNRHGATGGGELGVGPSVTLNSAERHDLGAGVSAEPELRVQPGIGGEIAAEKGEDGKTDIKAKGHAHRPGVCRYRGGSEETARRLTVTDSADHALRRNLLALRESMRDVGAEACSDDGLIRATVNGRGELVALELDPRIYRLARGPDRPASRTHHRVH